MKELLRDLSREQVKTNLRRIEPQESYSDLIADTLEEKVFGQREACKAVGRQLAMSEAGIGSRKKPLGSMLFLGPSGVGKCLHAKTPIYDPVDKTTKTVKERYKEGKSFSVYVLDENNNIVITEANPPQKFTRQQMYKVAFSDGSSLLVTDGHRLFLGNSYSDVATLRQRLSLGEQVHLPSISEYDLSRLPLNAPSFLNRDEDFQGDCHPLLHLYGLPLRLAKGIFRVFFPLSNDVDELYFGDCDMDDLGNTPKHNRHYLSLFRLSKRDFSFLVNNILFALRKFRFQLNISLQFLLYPQFAFQLMTYSNLSYREKEPVQSSRFSTFYSHLLAYIHGITGIGQKQVVSIKPAGKSYYYDFEVPKYNNYWACGVFNHNTEMSRAVANYMFQDPDSDRVKIINMAEMTEKHYITKFVGSPPSYVGYNEKPLIPHDWLHKGRSVIVLDEFEKAHYDVRQLFLGVLDKGFMDAREGVAGTKPLDFRDSVIIFTANIAGRRIQEITEGRSFGFCDGEKDKSKDVEAAAHHGLKRHLSPEFVNRLDSIVVFQEIRDRAIHAKIYDKFLDERNKEIAENLGVYAPFFATTTEFRDYILDLTGDKGGREMRRILDRELFDKAADCVMGEDLMGKPIVADREDDCTYFYTDDTPAHREPEPEPPKAEEPKKGGSSSDLATLWKPYLTPPKGDIPIEKPKAPSGFIPKEEEKETPKEKPKPKRKPKGPDKPNNPPEDEARDDDEQIEVEITHDKLKENVVFMLGDDNSETIDIIVCTKKNKVATHGQIIRNVPLIPLLPDSGL